ncbi:PREDICTED: H/ACA ribonucleoprotein complex non-core subunit NAF1-like [Nelumbo nucifera]|uniref:H/ACA ribonucleoprotein complex subunit n=2 Tax=Nelumbo nucifera TaxID=4432 RepID=A0A1U8BEF2_NELNU|nr:PREDICTED: H/ACA ribonucleoprotein complex non-core subunit NAF1-like [Nelumbo nucifera]DAD20825.1 TPA_asm: hypothetical protein HUJ06_022288 [Nelumbo nucifera]
MLLVRATRSVLRKSVMRKTMIVPSLLATLLHHHFPLVLREVRRKRQTVDDEEVEIKDADGEEMVGWSDDDGEGVITPPIKSKNEVEKLPEVPPVDVALEPHNQILPVGVILSIIGAKVVEGTEKNNPLNEGSILWITETRLPLGLADEIFGPVKNPYYVVRYNLDKEVPDGISQGTPVSFVEEFANHVLNEKNLYKKGYDTSGENNEVFDEAEFSDDQRRLSARECKGWQSGVQMIRNAETLILLIRRNLNTRTGPGRATSFQFLQHYL